MLLVAKVFDGLRQKSAGIGMQIAATLSAATRASSLSRNPVGCSGILGFRDPNIGVLHLQETGQALVCFIVEYFVTGRHAPPISEDSQLMYRLTHNANNVEVYAFTPRD